jgi:hypothetical protein
MIRQFLPAAILLVILSSVQILTAQNVDGDEEYSVYRDLISMLYGDNHTVQFALEKRIRPKQDEAATRKYLAKKLSISADILDAYVEANRSESELMNNFGLRSKIHLIDDAGMRRLWNAAGDSAEEVWKAFREEYQTFGVITLSRVGFNRTRSTALIELGEQTGWLGGEGTYYLMKKERGRWIVRKKLCSWIS